MNHGGSAGDVALTAANTSTTTATATSQASGKTGIGASVALNIITNNADAQILDGATLTGAHNVTLSATSANPTTTTVAAGGTATSGTGVGASAAIGVVNSESTASLGTSAGTLTTTGFVMMSATHTGSSNTSADASAGGSKAAIGAAVAVNVESETSTATTKRSINAGGYVTIMADNAGAGTANAKAGSQGADAGASSPDAPKTGEASTADNQVGDQLDLASSEAPSNPDAANAKTSKPSAKTSKSQLNIAGAIGVNVETSSANASIPNGLTITATGLLTVHSSNDTDALAKGDGSAVANPTTTLAAAIADATAMSITVASAALFPSSGQFVIQIGSEQMLVTGGQGTTTWMVTRGHNGSTAVAHDLNDSVSETSTAKTTTVGVGVAINVVTATNQATVGNGTIASQGLTVEALMNTTAPGDTDQGTSNFTAMAVSGASGSGGTSGAGALALNIVTNTSQAQVAPTAQVTVNQGGSAGDVALTAANTSTTTATATSQASGKTGIGASVALNIITNNADAQILDGATLTGAHNVTLSATSANPTTTTVAAGGTATSGTGVGASAAIGVVNSESTASLGTSTGTLTTTGFVMIGATHSGSGNTSADASAGGSKAAIGAAVAVNVESETSTATTKRSINAGGYVTIMADNAGAGTANAKAGAQGADAAANSADAPKTGEASTADNQVGDQLDLASSEAPSDPDAANAKTAKPSAKTSKGQLNVAGAIGVNVETSSAQASIPNGLTITATGLLTVHTSNDTDGLAKGDGSATAGANTSSTSVGVGIAINYVRATNQATVGNGSVSSQGLTVEALMNTTAPGDTDQGTSNFTAMAVSGASGSGGTSGAGALALNIVTNTSQAQVAPTAQVTVNQGGSAGDVALTAANTSTTTATATSQASGKTGIGASVALNIITNNADAQILDGATLTGAHNVTLSATSANPTTTTTTAGGAATAGASVGASAAVGVVNSESSATLGTSAGTLTTTGFITVTATHTGSSNASADGSAKGGNNAVGAAIAVNVEHETSTATTNRDINAGGLVTFEADNAAAGAASATASVGGADGTSGSADAPNGSEDSSADSQTSDQLTLASQEAPSNPDAANANSSKPSAKSSSSTGGKLGLAAALGVNLVWSTAQATVPAGRTVTAQGLVTISASNDTDAAASGDGTQVGGKTAPKYGVGVGAAVNYVVALNQAIIGSGAQVTGQGVTVQALANHNGTGTDADSPPGVADGTDTFRATAVSGAGGQSFGVAGSLALNLVTNKNEALVNAASTGTQTLVALGSGDLTLTAENVSTVTANATAAQSGGKIGIGAVISVNVATNTAHAQIGDGVQITGGNNALLTANSNQTTSTTTKGGSQASGSLAFTPSIAVAVTSNDAMASLGAGNGLTLPGKLTISATHSGTTTAMAEGATHASGKAGIGVSLALNVSNDAASANLGRSVTTTGTGAASAASISASNAASFLANGVASEGGASPDSEKGAGTGDKGADADAQEQAKFAETEPGAPAPAAAAPADPSDPGNTSGVLSQSDALDENAKPSDSSTSADGESTSQGGGAGGMKSTTVGVAAAVGINVATSSSTATVADNVHLIAGGTLALMSTNGTSAGASALGTAVSSTQKNSVAAAVSINVVSVTNHASAGNNVTLQGSSITITALEPVVANASQSDDFRTWAISGSGGQNNALAGSFGINVINFGSTAGTQASIGSGGTVTSGGAITIEAADALVLRNIDGSAAFGGSNLGVGLSFGVNVVRHQTTAFIGSNTKADAPDALTVQATASILPAHLVLPWETAVFTSLGLGINVTSLPIEPTIVAVAGAVSGSTSVGGSVAVNVFFEQTIAYIGSSARINQNASITGQSDQSVTVLAADDLTIIDGAGGLSGGAETGIGLGLDVGVLLRDTEAYIGSSAKVNAVSTISVTAPITENITSLAAEVSAGGDTGVAGAISVYVLPSSNLDQAHIDNGATVVAGGNMTLSAGFSSANPETIYLIAGSLGAGGDAGVGISNTTLVKNETVEATIGTGVTIGSAGLSLRAAMPENITTIAVAGAGGGDAGVAGSATINVWHDIVEATIGGGGTQVTATGSISLLASDTTTMLSTAGALAGGGDAGVGAGVDVGVITKDTEAYIGTATVNAAGDVTVQAVSNEAITSLVATAAVGGSAGLAGSVGVYVVDVTTRSFIGLDPGDPKAVAGITSVTAQGNVKVAATEATKLLGIDGSLSAAGSVAAGAAAAVPIMDKRTEAFLGANANVTALGLGGAMTAANGHFNIGSGAYQTINEKGKGGDVTQKSVGPDASGRNPCPTPDRRRWPTLGSATRAPPRRLPRACTASPSRRRIKTTSKSSAAAAGPAASLR